MNICCVLLKHIHWQSSLQSSHIHKPYLLSLKLVSRKDIQVFPKSLVLASIGLSYFGCDYFGLNFGFHGLINGYHSSTLQWSEHIVVPLCRAHSCWWFRHTNACSEAHGDTLSLVLLRILSVVLFCFVSFNVPDLLFRRIWGVFKKVLLLSHCQLLVYLILSNIY